MLYVGNSSDQDVYLLRHLPFDDRNRFGHANWRVCKALAHEITPAYFTSYPNELLDAAPGIYNVERVDKVVEPYQSQLLDLYYIRLEAAISAGSVPASLLGAIYCSALPYWDYSPSLVGKTAFDDEWLREDVFQSVLQEAKTPSLYTIQAMLLYMQLPPQHVREPNHPGFWPLTNQLVGLAQETGLHIDPANWDIASSERHHRRVLWWAVYMHDKWLAHWLGRPSHIDDRQFSTAPLTMEDFTNMSSHPLDIQYWESVSLFVKLSRLTTVLSTVLDQFYTVNRSSSVMTPEEALSRAGHCQAQLKDVLEQQGSILLHPSRGINSVYTKSVLPAIVADYAALDYVFVFAYYGIAVSIQRALFACAGGTSYYDIEREMILFHQLFATIEDLLCQNDLVGLWLSYCKSNIAIIGSFMVTALLASTDDKVYQLRQGALEEFRRLLQRAEGRFEFAALPLLRLNLLVERFTDSRASLESPSEVF
ncbi:fungal-specific transcription factor domain-containing protein [Aspergillus unguis]